MSSRPILLLIGSAGACTQRYTNKASTAILLCKRYNHGPPGVDWPNATGGSKTLQPGETWEEPCPVHTPYSSFDLYFATRGATSCAMDAGCGDPNYGTCKSYPWWFGQGIGQDPGALWYGGIGVNWDGTDAGRGWNGDYGDAGAHYGLTFTCAGTKAGASGANLKCTVVDGTPQCTPNQPAPGGKANSGTWSCDADAGDVLQLDILDSPCKASEYCCPEAKHCLTPVTPVSDCGHNSSVCGAPGPQPAPTCCPVTETCVTVGAPCTTPPQCAAAEEYCCPDAKHCLKPAKNIICAGAGDCEAGEVCCPVTHECVKAGAACESNCTSPDAYCCPEAGKCLTPVKPEVSCATNASACGSDICCPVTKLCVTAGPNCTSTCSSTAEYCCPEAKACLTPTFTTSITKCASAADCGAGGTCCPLTGICVEVGAACDPLYPANATGA